MSNIVEIVDVAHLDTVYLSYDEPQKEEFWVKIKNMIPWAKRVDGVKGSDNAHKAAANISETERFILIDGDNMPDIKFFDQQLSITEENKNAQFRWRARNAINGIYYGNGGISSWTREYVKNMRTHENSDGSAHTSIEFCFDPLYWPMHDCWSTTYMNYSPKQAWRAGFREGVKLCTRNGKIPSSYSEFNNWVWPRNMNNLLLWQTLGRDIENGFWAIHGARCGTYYLMLQSNWDYTTVQSFDELDKLWEKHSSDNEETTIQIAKELNNHLNMNIVELNADISQFFKNQISKKWRNRGIMIKEIDIIREEEGW